ncbi:MAG: redoxin domain-containing protein [Myxococcales bacterium]|nr:redoxin domain-containing protein [Myxococcales bacterium]MCB9550365.1 redoxin domain-containing protein [Myxococcales bacterium]
MRLLATLLLALLPLTACGGGDDDKAEDTPRDTYPTANIGTAVGQTLQNHGFLLPDGADFALDEVFFEPQNRVLMVVTASGWCTACIEEQPKLQALHEEFAAAGLYTLVTVFQDEQFQAAGPAEAEEWQRRFDLDFTVVADPEFVLGAYYDASQTPMVMLVEVGTMEILSIETGFNEARVRAVINAKL